MKMAQRPRGAYLEPDNPELFSWLLEQMGELPLVRKSRQRVIPNPSKLLNVPA